MASLIPPTKNVAYSFELEVFDYSGKYLSAATFSTKSISKDGGSFTAITNAPTEISTTGVYTISLTAGEMNCDRSKIKFVITGAPDIGVGLFTTLRRIDDLGFPITSGRGILVDAAGRLDISAIAGTLQTARDIGASVLLSVGTGTGQILITSGVISSNVVQWLAAIPAALTTNGFIQVLLMRWLTDDSGGTPSALSTNNVTADVKLIETVDATNQIRDAILNDATRFAGANIGNINTVVTTISAKLGGIAGSSINTVLGYFQALFRNDVSMPSDIGGTPTPAQDSLQAIRLQGDSAWTTSTGVGDWTTTERSQIRYRLGMDGATATPTATPTLGTLPANVTQIAGDSSAPTNEKNFFNGTGYAGTNNVIPTVTSVTNPVTVSSVPDSAGVGTLVGLITPTRAGYLDALAGFTTNILSVLRAMARKDVSASVDLGGGHLPSTDSEEAMREKLDTLSPASPIESNTSVTES